MTKEEINQKLQEFGNFEYKHVAKLFNGGSYHGKIFEADGKVYNATNLEFKMNYPDCGICGRECKKQQVITTNIQTGTKSCNICKQVKKGTIQV